MNSSVRPETIVISSYGAISALGHDQSSTLESYSRSDSKIESRDFEQGSRFCAALSPASDIALKNSLADIKRIDVLDRSVKLAIFAARQAISKLPLNYLTGKRVLVALGSSRGATELFEKYHRHFISSNGIKLPAISSPTTTLGNTSSFVAQALNLESATLELSVTCSTALHAIINGIAWLKADMCDLVIAGGSEAPLTGFSIAQMEALRIYSKNHAPYPCKPLLTPSTDNNSFVLGEGAFVTTLEREADSHTPIAKILGFGSCSEKLLSPTSITHTGEALVSSMRQAVGTSNLPSFAILHAPGTIKGDSAELIALRSVFKGDLPTLFSNKWLIGHTVGASGGLSLECALLALNVKAPIIPKYNTFMTQLNHKPNSVLVNATGFGGNAASILVSSCL